MSSHCPRIACSFLALVAVCFTGQATAQYAERPDLMGSGSPAVDCSGRSIKNQRVRAIHAENPRLPGTTAYFINVDPFLAYQLGRNLSFREFRDRDGVFSDQVSQLGGPMPDGTTAKITANNQVSCLGCHNIPSGNPGGSASFSKDSGLARNSPHYFGAGIVEMLAIQVHADILRQIDANRDGWINIAESTAAGHVLVAPEDGAPPIDYGNFSLNHGHSGSPEPNNIFRVWYVDGEGRVVPDATEVDGSATMGYNFGMIVWGFGQGRGRSALNPTNRAFVWDPFVAHGGLEAYDPSTTRDPDGDGVSLPTLSGAIQFPVSHRAPDAGDSLHPTFGFSQDDPDQDGYLNEISEGDLDLAEWFMLNLPRPAFAGTPAEYDQGVGLLDQLRCTDCHVPNWTIRPRDEHFEGDRRFIDFETRWNPADRRVEGRLVRLYDREGPFYRRRFDGFEVAGLFSDLKHHDMGAGFTEIDFGGTHNTLWRTPPLWGVGSGFPWGHDGQSLTLEQVILRHDGEGAASRDAFRSLSANGRRQVIEFLGKLQLYDIESLPADIDGDGVISEQFMVKNRDTGQERFNAEWLFRRPVRIQGDVTNIDGITVRSFAATNRAQAYGEHLLFRRDQDSDGWPDVWDAAPHKTGYRDGVH